MKLFSMLCMAALALAANPAGTLYECICQSGSGGNYYHNVPDTEASCKDAYGTFYKDKCWMNSFGYPKHLWSMETRKCSKFATCKAAPKGSIPKSLFVLPARPRLYYCVCTLAKDGDNMVVPAYTYQACEEAGGASEYSRQKCFAYLSGDWQDSWPKFCPTKEGGCMPSAKWIHETIPQGVVIPPF
ncbi:hypothetical protein LZ31DRAFT_556937 [Colletotrichum somersetense]|nr:hypothetical protein LZ31DRAFT_556937 [Colletotrichum somersetense]